jgi:hypothetical protein
MGARTVRDTIFINESGERYEVSNRKWVDNDYDSADWTLPESEADQAMPTYLAEYDPAKKKLTPAPLNKKCVPLYFADDKIYWGEEKALEYYRVAAN